jgi:hypothetical protein
VEALEGETIGEAVWRLLSVTHDADEHSTGETVSALSGVEWSDSASASLAVFALSGGLWSSESSMRRWAGRGLL